VIKAILSNHRSLLLQVCILSEYIPDNQDGGFIFSKTVGILCVNSSFCKAAIVGNIFIICDLSAFWGVQVQYS
jgi:hypothetical protein